MLAGLAAATAEPAIPETQDFLATVEALRPHIANFYDDWPATTEPHPFYTVNSMG